MVREATTRIVARIRVSVYYEKSESFDWESCRLTVLSQLGSVDSCWSRGRVQFAARRIRSNRYASSRQLPGAGLGQPVIIDNRGAALVAEMVAKAPADGYTLAFAGTTLWLAPFLRESV